MTTPTLRCSLLTALLLGGVTSASLAQGVPSLSPEHYSQYQQGQKADGVRTFSPSKNSPLYLVDGTPVTQEQLHTITPKQIHKIDIVKDSRAVALYGPRATNGAVLITTKK
ncbi:TonB-dependent receptor plug domain-containing protein [Hymenobacter crusticola]|uniref:TonB-dependent receptor plug domain-containing protein n=1 Tax=Hymenobacter crusticola TaxID=1770526 RepID=A0A243W7I3_9BACT|nr:TonB-dependent receptor plug domain-containing protein [Hymenobacter crusticola]OUJ71006.1 hypothetical protein BXP70_22820 [Hymenobacter crusticola]